MSTGKQITRNIFLTVVQTGSKEQAQEKNLSYLKPEILSLKSFIVKKFAFLG